MKKRKARAAAAVELAAVLMITAAAFAWGQRAALIERGYTAHGGEYLLLLIPAIYYTGKQIALDWIAEFQKTQKGQTEEEWIRPLEIAFMGYNDQITKIAFIQFERDNSEEIAEHGRTRREYLRLKDGTRITKITPGMIYFGADGYRFDQLILADDSRKEIYSARWREISLLVETAMYRSCVPERYKILFYDLDAKDPRDKTGKGAEEYGNVL